MGNMLELYINDRVKCLTRIYFLKYKIHKILRICDIISYYSRSHSLNFNEHNCGILL